MGYRAGERLAVALSSPALAGVPASPAASASQASAVTAGHNLALGVSAPWREDLVGFVETTTHEQPQDAAAYAGLHSGDRRRIHGLGCEEGDDAQHDAQCGTADRWIALQEVA